MIDVPSARSIMSLVRSRFVPGLFLILFGALTTSAAAQDPFDRLSADLRSSRESTRLRAVRQVSISGHPDAPAMLAPLLLDLSNTVQLETIDALLTMVLAPAPDPQRATTFDSKDGSIARDVFEAGPLAVLPHEMPPAVVLNLSASMRDDDARVRTSAAAALGVLTGGALDAEVSRAVVTDIVYGLQQPDSTIRQAIARAAGAVFARRPGEEPPVAVGDALIAAMNDADADVRIAAMDALGRVHEVRAEQSLADRVTFYGNGDEALSALHALARLAPAARAGLFREHLSDRDPAFRVVAIEGLGRVGDRSNVAAINAVLNREKDSAVLLAGALAFYRLGEEGNLDRIIAALVNPQTARQARAYITELCPGAASRLQQYLQQPDPRMRQAASEMLGLCGDRASEPALQVAARDSDRAAAEAARQALLRLRALPAGVRLH